MANNQGAALAAVLGAAREDADESKEESRGYPWHSEMRRLLPIKKAMLGGGKPAFEPGDLPSLFDRIDLAVSYQPPNFEVGSSYKYEMQICAAKRGGRFTPRLAFADLPLPPKGRTWQALLGMAASGSSRRAVSILPSLRTSSLWLIFVVSNMIFNNKGALFDTPSGLPPRLHEPKGHKIIVLLQSFLTFMCSVTDGDATFSTLVEALGFRLLLLDANLNQIHRAERPLATLNETWRHRLDFDRVDVEAVYRCDFDADHPSDPEFLIALADEAEATAAAEEAAAS